jgi:hypothetical protein
LGLLSCIIRVLMRGSKTLFSLVLLLWVLVLAFGCGAEYPKARPEDADIIGTYKTSELKLEGDLMRSVRAQDVTLTLQSDHKALVTNFPTFDMTGGRLICRLSGWAEWQLSNQENGSAGWTLVFNNFNSSTLPTSANSVCNTTYPMPALAILGEKAPHRLLLSIGDSSGEQSIEFERAP